MFRSFFSRHLLNQSKSRSKKSRRSRRETLQQNLSRQLRLEPLEDRRLLTVNITSSNTIAGQFIFTGDGTGVNESDALTLSRTVGGLLTHNLVSNGVFFYTSPQDMDPIAAGDQTYV